MQKAPEIGDTVAVRDIGREWYIGTVERAPIVGVVYVRISKNELMACDQTNLVILERRQGQEWFGEWCNMWRDKEGKIGAVCFVPEMPYVDLTNLIGKTMRMREVKP